MPFGLCNALDTLQRCVMAIFNGLVEDITEVFMYDFSAFGYSFDLCLQYLEFVLRRFEETYLDFLAMWESIEDSSRTSQTLQDY